jgi:nitric oxide reductase NorE protein
LPGWEGVWVFIAADMIVFGLLFASFVIERGKNVDLFNLSRKALNFNYGGINTLILLTSSWFVVLAVQAVKANKLRQVPHFLALGVLCGTTFGMLKIVEYTEKLSAGISALTNDFYMFYFILTGIHLLHVVGGLVVLVFLWRKARLGAYNGTNCAGLESGASFWHMVDLLWIFLFPLLYLMQ